MSPGAKPRVGPCPRSTRRRTRPWNLPNQTLLRRERRAGQGPSGSYEGEGFVVLRHPETEVVEKGLRRLVTLIRVEMAPEPA